MGGGGGVEGCHEGGGSANRHKGGISQMARGRGIFPADLAGRGMEVRAAAGRPYSPQAGPKDAREVHTGRHRRAGRRSRPRVQRQAYPGHGPTARSAPAPAPRCTLAAQGGLWERGRCRRACQGGSGPPGAWGDLHGSSGGAGGTARGAAGHKFITGLSGAVTAAQRSRDGLTRPWSERSRPENWPSSYDRLCKRQRRWRFAGPGQLRRSPETHRNVTAEDAGAAASGGCVHKRVATQGRSVQLQLLLQALLEALQHLRVERGGGRT